MNDTPAFGPLSKLFRGDTDRMRRALEIFERVTREDLGRMDQAWAGRDWPALGRLVHRTRSGCLQIGEVAAADGLATIERASSSSVEAEGLAKEFAATRAELDQMMQRVTAFLKIEDSTGKK